MGNTRRSRVRSRSLALGAAVLAMALAACGSQLHPDDVIGVSAQRGTTTVDPGTGLPVDDGTGDFADTDVPLDDSGAPIDPGAPGGSDAGTGDNAGSTGNDGGNSGGNNSGSGGKGNNSGGNQGAPAGNIKAGSCDGFKNGPGITDDTITISNVSDIKGPVQGLFEASQDAVRAYVAYFNATSDICGRKLKLVPYDSRTDAGADQQGYVQACANSFAAVGSNSAFDSGGAKTAVDCKIPDLRATNLTHARSNCANCFSTQALRAGVFHNALPTFVKKNFPNTVKHAALLYLNAGAAAENAATQEAAMTKQGMNFVVSEAIGVDEPNYTAYVQELKKKDARYVQFLGAYLQAERLASTMRQQNFWPEVFMLDPAAYDPKFVTIGGKDVEDTHLFVNFVPFEEASSNKEMQTYLQWLRQVKPGASPDYFGVYSWSAAKLFVERAKALGGKLSRDALVADLRKVSKWTADGMHAPMEVGAKMTGECQRFLKLQGGKWVPIGGKQYICTGLTNVN